MAPQVELPNDLQHTQSSDAIRADGHVFAAIAASCILIEPRR
jgi:hypothetical protein